MFKIELTYDVGTVRNHALSHVLFTSPGKFYRLEVPYQLPVDGRVLIELEEGRFMEQVYDTEDETIPPRWVPSDIVVTDGNLRGRVSIDETHKVCGAFFQGNQDDGGYELAGLRLCGSSFVK